MTSVRGYLTRNADGNHYLGRYCHYVLFSAFTSLLQYIAGDNQLNGVDHRILGNLAISIFRNILIVSVALLLFIPVITRRSWSLNAMTDGIVKHNDSILIAL